jgi:hypothetical protein
MLLIFTLVVNSFPKTLALILNSNTNAAEGGYLAGAIIGNIISIFFAICLYKIGKKWIYTE